MKSLVEYLYPAPAPRRVPSIIGWWERRRPLYNVIVGSAGVVGLGTTALISWIPPFSEPLPLGLMWQPVLAVGLLANLCYFLGPAVEIAVEKLSRGGILPLGPVLFRMGLTFSVGLVLLPVLVVLLGWGISVLELIF